jgi:Mn-dependent DtxR family transcriptional regulator
MAIVYTQEVIAEISAIYTANPGLDTVAVLAKKLDVSPRSIISKLSSLGIYKKKEYLNKRGEPPIKKEIYIDGIAEMLGIEPQLLESMEKVTKIGLTQIYEGIKDNLSYIATLESEVATLKSK